ncbi:hypothetical protein CgunFtcFv8_015408 [Champsocephalus gunnari]|uniref:Chemokine interleukin-8-like domain-containing protein n=1 Tax=Champsocephalus gunnari TaxID=52237 RepID=A0AAN8GZR9_CHAGU|nr:hypothetical protein CgunFtcFv8_015408 [Champsocephalus gunnari]
MWTSLSVSRWIFLLTLTAVTLFSASGVDSNTHIKCCKPFRQPKINPIKHCYKQTQRHRCRHDAYKITDENGRLYCVKPTPPWLQKRLNAGLNCSPDISPNLRKRFG